MTTKEYKKIEGYRILKNFMKLIGRSDLSQRVTERKQMFELTKINKTAN